MAHDRQCRLVDYAAASGANIEAGPSRAGLDLLSLLVTREKPIIGRRVTADANPTVAVPRRDPYVFHCHGRHYSTVQKYLPRVETSGT